MKLTHVRTRPSEQSRNGSIRKRTHSDLIGALTDYKDPSQKLGCHRRKDLHVHIPTNSHKHPVNKKTRKDRIWL